MLNTLLNHRKIAALAAGGTSGQEIKDLVIKVINSNGIRGNALDYGAGKGELLSQLNRLSIFDVLAGVDLIERPNSLDPKIYWHQQDLNEPLGKTLNGFNVLIASEIVEHLENPRACFRDFYEILPKNGHLVVTIPNQESIRAYLGLILGGHFADFLGNSYPAHIVALLRLDLRRICSETGFHPPRFYFSNRGRLPKLPSRSWQSISFGMLSGRLFSDNMAMYTRKV